MNDINKAINPFGNALTEVSTHQLMDVEQERAIQEVQAAMLIAKHFPRQPVKAMDRILQACSRTTLAESAMYAYPRGAEMVTGPSIRLAEAIAQHWGNLQFGIRELSQQHGESTVEAYAWDIENNTKQVKVFQVPHRRYTKKGVKPLTDSRDIYELVANQGARRLRACILGVIPGDVVEAAVRQCEITLKNSVGVPEEKVKQLVEAFAGFGVSKAQIEKRLGHRLESTIAAEVLSLRKIYTSIKDNMSTVEDWFEPEDGAEGAAGDINAALKKSKGKPAEVQPVEKGSGAPA